VKLPGTAGDQLPITSTTSPIATGMFVPMIAFVLPTLRSATAPLMRTRKPDVSPCWKASRGSSSCTMLKFVAAVKLKPRLYPL